MGAYQRNGASKGARYDWSLVQQFYDAGNDRHACMARFGFSSVGWYKAIQRGRLRATISEKRYDWTAVQSYYDEGHTARATIAWFGMANQSWTKAILRGDLKSRGRRVPLGRLLATTRYRHTVKRRLIDAGILKNVCDECGISEWRGKPLAIQLDHRNGIRDDHRPENLRMLCPNCHSQTETFAGKNRGRLSKQPLSRVV